MILHFIRNLDQIPFGSSEASRILKKEIPEILQDGKWLKRIEEAEEKKLLQAYFFHEPYKALFFDPKSKILIALGSFDHLHVLYDGEYQELKPVLSTIHARLQFAHDPNFGFLTTRLHQTGTGFKGKFFHALHYPQTHPSIEAVPYEGGYLYQNHLSIGCLESTWIESLKSLENSIKEHIEKIKHQPSSIALKIFGNQ
ncbi:MAG: hypothetical protein FJZ61_05375 [Chlamydiae bacterium]|nr:hypothetical protein [Chlamydiota bacterium]